MLPEDAAVHGDDDDEHDILVLVRKFYLKSCTWLKTRLKDSVIVDTFHEDHH